MDKRIKMGLLLDFYGSLLSDKQYDAMSLYYYDDLSLQEIGDIEKVSKQAISNLILRAEDKLREIDKSMNLLQKNLILQKKLGAVLELLNEVEDVILVDEAKKQIRFILKEISGR